eukprot:364584-Chlamydomonas_euryale.AAC.10
MAEDSIPGKMDTAGLHTCHSQRAPAGRLTAARVAAEANAPAVVRTGLGAPPSLLPSGTYPVYLGIRIA